MKDYKIKSETLLALGSTCCLLYMRHYESAIYYRNMNIILAVLYSFIAIPFFYFFITACFMAIFVKLFNIHISRLTKVILKQIDFFMIIIYVIFLVLKMIGFITIGNIPFVSVHWIIFIAWGCIFSIDVNSQIKKGDLI